LTFKMGLLSYFSSIRSMHVYNLFILYQIKSHLVEASNLRNLPHPDVLGL